MPSKPVEILSHAHEEPQIDQDPPESPEEAVRNQVLAEMQQEMAVERFQSEQPELWMQVQRLSKLLDLQGECEGEVFPEGACFLHASLPDVSSFCLRQILEIDLDTCLATIEIYGDDEFEAGIVLLPIERVSWVGFPNERVPVKFEFQGFVKRALAAEKRAKEIAERTVGGTQAGKGE